MTTCDHCRGIHEGCKATCPLCGRGLCHELPTKAEILAACVAIRRTWPPGKLRDQEGWQELEVPMAHQATDHMRRNDGESEARK